MLAILACLLAGLAAAPPAAKKPAAKSPAAKSTAKRSTVAKARPRSSAKVPAVVRKPVYVTYTYQHLDRDSSFKWVTESMEPQQETFDNVRGLVPFFEQLYQSSKTNANLWKGLKSIITLNH